MFIRLWFPNVNLTRVSVCPVSRSPACCVGRRSLPRSTRPRPAPPCTSVRGCRRCGHMGRCAAPLWCGEVQRWSTSPPRRRGGAAPTSHPGGGGWCHIRGWCPQGGRCARGSRRRAGRGRGGSRCPGASRRCRGGTCTPGGAALWSRRRWRSRCRGTGRRPEVLARVPGSLVSVFVVSESQVLVLVAPGLVEWWPGWW